MTMITPSYLGETIEYSSLHACRSTLEDPTDGSTPTASSTLYSGPITVVSTETINAIATATGYQTSPVASVLYTINLPSAATPTYSVPPGTYTTPQTVSISDATTGAAIYYTTDGSTPTAGTGTSKLYSGSFTLLATETIQAIAEPTSTAINYTPSAVASATYTINLPVVATPIFSVTAGTYATVQSVSISDTTSGAKIYYTTDGSTPTAASTLYSGSITVAVSATIKAIAIDSPNYNNSAIATAAIMINLPPAAFSITSASSTIIVTGGRGTATLTITANAAFNGTAAFSCSGFLPIGASCAFAPTSVSALALGTATTTLTVTVPAATANLRHSSRPVLPSTMLAATLCFLGFRKRRRLQLLLLFMVSAIGMSMFTACATTTPSSTTSSQIVVTASGSSLPVNAPSNTQTTPVSATLPLVLTVQ